MATSKRELLLICGIPGTGKTEYGRTFAKQFGFVHYNLEEQQTLGRFASNPTQFIADIVGQNRDAVVTWGFVPIHPPSVSAVLQFKANGFKLVWFDGNRPAALRAFQKRGDVPEEAFYSQMYRIENSRIIETIQPTIINSFDASEKFKTPETLLEEIRNA